MLAKFLSYFKRTHVYVKIRKNQVWAKHLETQNIVEVVSPEPFTTERLLIGQWPVAEAVVKSTVRQSYANKRLFTSPNILVQPLEYLEGGLSGVEERTLMELASFAGAFERLVWVGPELTDEQVLEKFAKLQERHRKGEIAE